MNCRHCNTILEESLVDLGTSPPCNTLVSQEGLEQPEVFYPLHAMVCTKCFLVQVGEFVAPDDIFSEYSYFSSYSDSWVEHARRYVHDVVARFNLDKQTKVFEVASNDGYLLQHFLPLGVPVLGIEPAKNVAEAARAKGINTTSVFLGSDTARAIVAEHGHAELVAANNVMAHTPYLNDFIAGLRLLLSDTGVVTVEFPHLLHLMEQRQFDTIYHEHFSYFSFLTVNTIFKALDLHIFDVEELSTHGGSLRIFATPNRDNYETTQRVQDLLDLEQRKGLNDISYYTSFTEQVQTVKRNLLDFLIQAKRNGKTVGGYGAPGKGNTLLNYCGIRTDLVDYLVDRNPYKQDNFAPGTRIPIHAPEHIFETKPDYVLVMVWNLVDEVVDQMEAIRDWGGKFVIAIPDIKVIE